MDGVHEDETSNVGHFLRIKFSAFTDLGNYYKAGQNPGSYIDIECINLGTGAEFDRTMVALLEEKKRRLE